MAARLSGPLTGARLSLWAGRWTVVDHLAVASTQVHPEHRECGICDTAIVSGILNKTFKDVRKKSRTRKMEG